MKKAEPKPISNPVQATITMVKPVAPFASRQAFAEYRVSDPSSVVRSDRYPIPAFLENRFRGRD